MSTIRYKPLLKYTGRLYRQLLNSGYGTATGGVIYSGDETLKKGKYLFYGLNPGGDGGHSIEQDFKKKHLDLKDSSYNHMCNGVFYPRGQARPAGEATLQRRYKFLFSKLGVEPRHVCMTNLIFIQSTNERASWCIQLSGWKVEKSRRCHLQEGGTWQLELPGNNRTASKEESFADKLATFQPLRYQLSSRNH